LICTSRADHSHAYIDAMLAKVGLNGGYAGEKLRKALKRIGEWKKNHQVFRHSARL
jgi:hypothetical protein